MEVTKTSIDGLVILEPKIFGDDRGYFMESYKSSFFKEYFLGVSFIQDNESKSGYGVLRGLHFQKPPFAQAKLVRVLEGEVLDVAVDLRKDSPTYGKHESVVLSAENKKQFYVPRGFAHGFVVLSKTATFFYKVDNVYAPDYDSGIIFNDAALNIDWKIDQAEIQLSPKDKQLQLFQDFQSEFRL